MPKTELFVEIKNFIAALKPDSISPERKPQLKRLSQFIRQKHLKGVDIRMHFICTHNSRRSIFAQVWAQTLASYYHINHVHCYSGGTEKTAVYPLVLEVLKQSGFQWRVLSKNQQTIYALKYAANSYPILGFSKLLNDPFNPSTSFVAIMTCNSAHEACPVVEGAEEVISITYDDPKLHDNTSEQLQKYQACNLQIANELSYVFSLINA